MTDDIKYDFSFEKIDDWIAANSDGNKEIHVYLPVLNHYIEACMENNWYAEANPHIRNRIFFNYTWQFTNYYFLVERICMETKFLNLYNKKKLCAPFCRIRKVVNEMETGIIIPDE